MNQGVFIFGPTPEELAYLTEYGYEKPDSIQRQMAMQLPSLIQMRSPVLFQQKWVDWRHPTHNYGVLHHVIEQNDVDFLDILLSFAGYREQLIQSKWGSTPIVVAAARGNLDAMRILIKWGAPPFLCHREGKCPFYFSYVQNRPDVSVLVLKHERDTLKKQGRYLNYYYHMSICCSGIKSGQTPDWYVGQCVATMKRRLANAYKPCVVLLALAKRWCDPNVWRHILQPMIQTLWEQYCVFPMWEK